MLLRRAPSTAVRAAMTRSTRQMSAASPAMLAAYRSHAEDKLLQHMSKVAARAHSKGELEQSAELYEHLVLARRERHGDRHPLTLHAIGALSTVAKDCGNLDFAENLAREAATVSAEMLGEKHPDSLRNMENLAQVLSSQQKLEEAERCWKKRW